MPWIDRVLPGDPRPQRQLDQEQLARAGVVLLRLEAHLGHRPVVGDVIVLAQAHVDQLLEQPLIDVLAAADGRELDVLPQQLLGDDSAIVPDAGRGRAVGKQHHVAIHLGQPANMSAAIEMAGYQSVSPKEPSVAIVLTICGFSPVDLLHGADHVRRRVEREHRQVILVLQPADVAIAASRIMSILLALEPAMSPMLHDLSRISTTACVTGSR